MSFAAEASRTPNRLVHEQSPYLLQHAYNPVAWYPWGEEAFAKARAEERPIFLSIGYSTCHWCHVMEQESFENDEIARLLNESFVAIKVDREERPDLDQVYMASVMALTGAGGWPMTVFLTPEGKPFYGGTYFPPERRWGRPGLKEVLTAVATGWRQDRQRLLASAEQLTTYLQQAAGAERSGAEGALPTADVLDAAYRQFAASFDDVWGGFGDAPKFPRPHALFFLLRYWHRTGEAQALAMVERTLTKMADGGMHDQVGGGFHRYSVDREWLVPHFEKMLYDQALLARAYLEAYQATGRAAYADVARGIFDYVLRDLTDDSGGFYSAEDADSEGEEGKFYVWTPQELEAVLGAEEAALVGAFYGVRPGGNFSATEHGGEHGWSILHIEQPLEAFAALQRIEPSALAQRLGAARQRLLRTRSRRVRPHRDDKILTDWNGLMISALAFGAAVLEEPRYRDAAVAAAEFLLRTMQHDERLWHRYRGGDAAVEGFLDDYAYGVQGLLDLYETTGDPRWLQEAVRLTDLMIADFGDIERGGFFLRSRRAEQAEPLIVSSKEWYDGAVPSGNSAAVLDLVRLTRMTGQPRFEERAETLLRAAGEQIGQAPTAYPYLLCALDLALGPSWEVVLAGAQEDDGIRAMRRVVFGRFFPRRVLLLHPADGAAAIAIEALAPFVAAQHPLQGRATAYVCQQFTCRQPTTDPSELAHLLTAP